MTSAQYNPADFPDGKGPRPPADGASLDLIDRTDALRIRLAIHRASIDFARLSKDTTTLDRRPPASPTPHRLTDGIK